MKIYLPGYYLRSLRNQPLAEIDAEEINATIRGHQCEVQKTRTIRNLKAFEELSRSRRVVKVIDERVLRPASVEVPPLVQEFIRDTGDEESNKHLSAEVVNLTQTVINTQEVQNEKKSEIQQCDSKDKMPVSNTQSCASLLQGCQRIQAVQAPYSSDFPMSASKQTVFYHSLIPVNEPSFSKVFKAKFKKNTKCSIFKSPNFNAIRITNLSYSQPSTPKTPMYRSLLCGTPVIQKSTNISSPTLSQCVPFTPMLHEALKLLDSIPERNEENVDLLNIIDDDTKPVEMVDKELDLYSEVNDANVADYVLNIAMDYPLMGETKTFQKVPKTDSFQKRKCQRAKPVFLEESENFKEQKRQKDRERRKKRKIMFEKKSPLGTRRSNRKLRPPPRVPK